MKLTNMKMSAGEAKAATMCSPEPADEPKYPYGLNLSLGDEELDKLGLKGDMPETGETYILTARVKVTECSSRDTQGDGVRSSVNLQITDLALDEDSKTDAEAVYGKGKA
jgi:hypothetical protein